MKTVKNGQAWAQRKKVADCIRLLLAGKVSCDHVLDEFGKSDDPRIREILALIDEAVQDMGRYGTIGSVDAAFKERMERLLEGLLAGESGSADIGQQE